MRPLNVGDRVKVKIPRIVVRVGYPKAVSDYLPEYTALEFQPLGFFGVCVD